MPSPMRAVPGRPPARFHSGPMAWAPAPPTTRPRQDHAPAGPRPAPNAGDDVGSQRTPARSCSQAIAPSSSPCPRRTIGSPRTPRPRPVTPHRSIRETPGSPAPTSPHRRPPASRTIAPPRRPAAPACPAGPATSGSMTSPPPSTHRPSGRAAQPKTTPRRRSTRLGARDTSTSRNATRRPRRRRHCRRRPAIATPRRSPAGTGAASMRRR